jgi:hypothetical protein
MAEFLSKQYNFEFIEKPECYRSLPELFIFTAYVSMPQQMDIFKIVKHWGSFASHCI